jgi:hypothetical protein
MILRMWRGVTHVEKAQAFFEYVKETGEPAYLAAKGNRGVLVIRRPIGEDVEFLLLSLWDSIEDVKSFAGPDYGKALYPFPRDREFLVKLEEVVEHFDVLSWQTR